MFTQFGYMIFFVHEKGCPTMAAVVFVLRIGTNFMLSQTCNWRNKFYKFLKNGKTVPMFTSCGGRY